MLLDAGWSPGDAVVVPGHVSEYLALLSRPELIVRQFLPLLLFLILATNPREGMEFGSASLPTSILRGKFPLSLRCL